MTAPRHNLIHRLMRWLLLCCLCTGLWLTTSMAWAADLEGARQSLREAQAQVQALDDQRATLEGEYQSMLDRIQRLKRDRGQVDIVDDLQLKQLLKDARGIANNLKRLAQQLDAAQTREATARKALLDAYNSEIASLEQNLFDDGVDVGALTAKLETLQQERAQLLAQRSASTGVVALPDLGTIDTDNPEDIADAVGELEDHERRLRAEIDSVDSQITELEKQRQLVAINEDLQDQDRAFEEGVIGFGQRGTTSRQGATTNDGTSATAAESGGQQSNQGGSDAVVANNSRDVFNAPALGAADPDTSNGAEDMGAPPPAAPVTENDGGVRQGADVPTELGDVSGIPTANPTVPVPQVPVGGDVSTVVIRSDADPSLVGGDTDSAPVSLDGELRQLRDRKAELRRSLEKIESEKQRLEDRVDALGGY